MLYASMSSNLTAHGCQEKGRRPSGPPCTAKRSVHLSDCVAACSQRDLSWRFRALRHAPDEQRHQHLWRTNSANGPPQLAPHDARSRARHELPRGKVEATGELGRMCWPEEVTAAYFLDDFAQAVDGPACSCRAADLTRGYGQTRKARPAPSRMGCGVRPSVLNTKSRPLRLPALSYPSLQPLPEPRGR